MRSTPYTGDLGKSQSPPRVLERTSRSSSNGHHSKHSLHQVAEHCTHGASIHVACSTGLMTTPEGCTCFHPAATLLLQRGTEVVERSREAIRSGESATACDAGRAAAHRWGCCLSNASNILPVRRSCLAVPLRRLYQKNPGPRTVGMPRRYLELQRCQLPQVLRQRKPVCKATQPRRRSC